MLKAYSLRTVKLIFGLFLYGAGSYLTIQANIGLAPWEAFNIGVSQALNVSYGVFAASSSLLIVFIDFLLKEKIGFGTLLNALLIGTFTSGLLKLNPVPMMQSFLPGLGVMLLGQLVICLGSYFYMSAALGCGPRDAIMVAIGKRLPKAPIGLIRGLIEGTVLLVGWLLDAKVGVGTIISVFGIGFILQFTFKLLHFDAKALVHESFADTVRRIRGAVPAAAEE